MSKKNIDCSVPCFTILNLLNSCPKKKLILKDIFFLNPSQIFEIFMIVLSISPYFICFLLLILTALIRTTRCFFLLLMIFIENYFIEVIKNILKDPRPNWECNKQYGNPSNHAVFYSALCTWFIAEYFYCDRKFRFKNNFVKFLCFFFTPIVIYSRVYLNYHSNEQVNLLGLIIK